MSHLQNQRRPFLVVGGRTKGQKGGAEERKKNRTFESPTRFAQHSCVAALPSAFEIRTAGKLALTAPSPSS